MSPEGATRPRVLCVMQLPPPVHGVTTINLAIAHSAALAARFELDVLPLRFSETIAELGRASLNKVVRAGAVAAQLGWQLVMRRPAAIYITLAVQRPAIYRDLALLNMARAAHVARIVHLHATPDPEVLPILRRGLAGATVILLSSALRPGLVDAVEDAQVRYVANGLPELAEVRRDDRPVPRVLFLSNLLLAKGPLTLAAALLELARRGLAFEATFAGAATRELSQDRLRSVLAPLGARARVVGIVDDATKQLLLREHDIFAFPTARDAFPLVVLEAMRAGLAIVSTKVGAIHEMLDETALFVPPADPRKLADALARLIAAPSARANLGAAARARYLSRYTIGRFETELGDVIAGAVEG